MKKMSPFFWIILLGLFAFVAACNGDKEKTEAARSNKELFEQVILDHTHGEIGVDDVIRIVFNKDMVKEEALKEDLDLKYFKSTPQVSGKLYWDTPGILVFKADKFDFDREYSFSVDLKKLLADAKDELPDQLFHFSIRTFPLDFEVIYQPLEVYSSPGGESKMALKGLVNFNSMVDSAIVKNSLSVDLEGPSPGIEWEHKGNVHHFRITDIVKEDNMKPMTLSWDLDGQEKGEEKRFLIPPIGEFTVLGASIDPENQRIVQITFSDFIDGKQEFKGLVELEGVSVTPEYLADANRLKLIYPGDLTGELTLNVERSIVSRGKTKLKSAFRAPLHFSAPKPAVKKVNAGTICVDVEQVIFPFEAINLHAVDVEIVKVYQSNVMQFLQYNQLNDTYMPGEVSEIIWQGKVDLAGLSKSAVKHEWHRYGLNLMEFIKLEKGALYNVRIGFRKQYAQYPCETDGSKAFEEAGIGELETEQDGYFNSIWKGWYSYSGSRWSDREDPCKPMYYTSDNFIQQNLLASNMGILAKYDAREELFLSVVDLKTGKPRGGVNLGVYSFQQQLIAEGVSNEEGILRLKVGHKAYFIISRAGEEYGYLKLNEYQPLSMTDFAVRGKQLKKGTDGIIFGERGVWRPGDTLYLNFVLRDPNNDFPSDQAVNFELFDPNGKSYFKTATAEHSGPFYSFTCHTDMNAPTGNWRAKVQAGPHTFEKSIKIETVKPNRLKILLDLGEGDLQLNQSELDLQVNWLTGLPGSDLRVNVDLDLKQSKTSFPKYSEFVFDDVSRKFNARELALFDDKMDSKGRASVKMKFNQDFLFPGKMKTTFKVRAYEKSGEFSTNSFQANLSPFRSYVGVNVPKSAWGSPSLKIDQKYDIPVIALDQEGEILAGRKLSVGVYKTQWRWWWDDSGNDLAQYNSDQHLMAFRKEKLTTGNDGKAYMSLELEDYGPYMIRVCDELSGHCTGELFYAGYYGGQDGDNDFATRLHFNADKKSYNKGEQVELTIPAGADARALITLETAGKVIKSEWLESKGELLKYTFKATEDMFPNVYAHVTMIQGVETKVSDLPLRRYGVLNIDVLDPEKQLLPEIKMSDEIKPNSSYSLEIRENDGKEMDYVIAVVDEGLLDLTNFKTPSLYDHFYARQALLTKNWDNFDEVISGKAALLDKIISIGGDDEVAINNDADKANRFVPVVRFEGPFHLAKGKKGKHELDMPNYSGAVRVMVIAASEQAYGSAEKSVVVKEDLMALLTAPRLLSPGESIELPVTVFVTSEKIREVEVNLSSNDLIEVEGDKAKMIRFDQPGEQIVYFSCQVKEKEGVAKLKATANAKNDISVQNMEIDVANPNTYQKSAKTFVLAPGEEKSFELPVIGLEGTNNAWVELSQMPSLDLENKLSYLISYPYGCVEQTTSSVFPQLYLNQLADMSQDRMNQVKINLVKGIERIRSFQNSQNGLAYWPGDQVSSEWGSVYAAHFLVEAKLKGYNTSAVLPGLLSYLKNVSTSFRFRKEDPHKTIPQAYRVMVLARAGNPEFSAMNYLYKLDDLPGLAKSFLSLAYSYAGKKEIAGRLLSSIDDFTPYRSTSLSYGSNLRDYAVLLQALDQAGLQARSASLMKDMLNLYNSRGWWNTQTLSWFFMSIAKRSTGQAGEIDAAVKYAGGDFTTKSQRPVHSFEVPEKWMKQAVKVTNNASTELFVSYVSQGKPQTGFEGENEQNNIVLTVDYLDENNDPISVDELTIGTEFKAIVSIRKIALLQDVEEMVLNQVFPSGWEILNWRMDGSAVNNNQLDYQDIRDDRVYSFFDLRNREVRIEIPLHASYAGNFFLPQQFTEAMYDDEVYARKAGKWVQVVRD